MVDQCEFSNDTSIVSFPVEQNIEDNSRILHPRNNNNLILVFLEGELLGSKATIDGVVVAGRKEIGDLYARSVGEEILRMLKRRGMARNLRYEYSIVAVGCVITID